MKNIAIFKQFIKIKNGISDKFLIVVMQTHDNENKFSKLLITADELDFYHCP